METSTVSFEQIEAALHRLPPQRLKEVLLFIEFLEYLAGNNQDQDDAEDAALWEAVLAHQAYRTAHPTEQPEEFHSSEAFLKATADL